MFDYLIKRANIVLEALPYLMKFHNKVIVIKYGGSAMKDPAFKQEVLKDIVLLKYVGMHPVVIHGGGAEINKYLKKRKIEIKFIKGLRVTDKEVMKVVSWVLGEKVNREICRLIKQQGGKPKGLSGKRGRIIKAKKIWIKGEDGEYLDLGFAGKVVGVKNRYLYKLIKNGYIPVLTSVGVGPKGNLFNINADSAAADIAGYLKADKLILLTDVRGVLDNTGKLISEVTAYRTDKLIKSGVIKGGMIPKVKCGLRALKMGVGKVHIIDGQIPHAILLELFTDRGIGTMVVKK